jgi:hypothetical protein
VTRPGEGEVHLDLKVWTARLEEQRPEEAFAAAGVEHD